MTYTQNFFGIPCLDTNTFLCGIGTNIEDSIISFYFSIFLFSSVSAQDLQTILSEDSQASEESDDSHGEYQVNLPSASTP